MKFMDRVYSEDPREQIRKRPAVFYFFGPLSLLDFVVKPHLVHDP